MNVDEAQEQLKVGRNPVVRVEVAVLFVARPATVEGGVGRNEPQPHQARSEHSRAVVAHALVQGFAAGIVDVGIDCVGPALLQGPGQLFDGRGRGVEVIAVQNADHVARSHAQSLVHGIIQAFVALADVDEPSLKARFVGTYDVHGSIGRQSVYDDVFQIVVGLGQHTLKRVGQGSGAVVCRGDDAEFHVCFLSQYGMITRVGIIYCAALRFWSVVSAGAGECASPAAGGRW